MNNGRTVKVLKVTEGDRKREKKKKGSKECGREEGKDE